MEVLYQPTILSRIVRALAENHRDVVALSGTCRILRAGVTMLLGGPPPLNTGSLVFHGKPFMDSCLPTYGEDWLYGSTIYPYVVVSLRSRSKLLKRLGTSETNMMDILELLRSRGSGGMFAFRPIVDALIALANAEFLDLDGRISTGKEGKQLISRLLQNDWERWIAFIQTNNSFS